MAVLQSWPAAHVVVPATQRASDSLHVSTPLHVTPSEQLRAEPPVHCALALHVVPMVQNKPFAHAWPVRAVHALDEVAGVQTWHGFAGLIVPVAKHTPPITQPEHVATQPFEAGLQIVPPVHVVAPGTHRSVVSLHVSVPLQAMPSSQKFVTIPAHRPPEHVSFVVQNIPSSQCAPSAGLNAVAERAGSQISHAFDGLAVIGA